MADRPGKPDEAPNKAVNTVSDAESTLNEYRSVSHFPLPQDDATDSGALPCHRGARIDCLLDAVLHMVSTQSERSIKYAQLPTK